MAKKKSGNDELIFIQSSSIQEREKVKELWKFLDSQCNLEPYKPLQSRCKLSLQSSTENRVCKMSENHKQSVSGETTSLKSVFSSETEVPEKERLWYHGLRFFQQIGLDKVALRKEKCKFCLAEKGFKSSDYADTMPQTYEELKAEMTSFDERFVDRELKTSNSLKN
ncbi:hypothetical protein KPH14_012539 [Odynerus spinipes]|uniref:Uncharacterized protein n=1 Tax=Odynerus spinipes TaxID=1348599 RepID=A0AAD9RIH1_9HYME|nr:hypothetical protein KPH14_012539 [Odynerus spinipes]